FLTMENELNNIAILNPTTLTMKDLLQEKNIALILPKVGDTLQGQVIEKGRNRIYLDLNGFRIGILYKTELENSNANLQDIKKGDVLSVKITDLENKDGLVEVSLMQATLDQSWEEVKNLKQTGEVLGVKITAANRGGLVAQVNGLPAFLPVSQLSSQNYPHVEGGDKEEILKLLKKFVGETLLVKVIDCDQKNGKVILSEKAKISKEVEGKLANYKVGDLVAGEISGLVDFGAFVTFDSIEGLVHISEIGWQLVEKPSDVLKIGDQIQAKVIVVEGDKISLSLKALKQNPWDEVDKKYKKGDSVNGTVVKFNPFGAFVKLDTEIQGLAHISEFKTYKDMLAAVELGKTYPFKISALEPKEYKLALQPEFELKFNNLPNNSTQS
ncbi:MAG: S1 RNA-binding domain-containing protein, partial [Patescibacteria group bacterium]